MDLIEKKDELIELISSYLKGRGDVKCLHDFTWNVIEYFNKKNKHDLPPYQDFEDEFWYTIWEIQHLADKEHEKDGLIQKTLADALSYLTKNKAFPKTFSGKKP